MPKKYFDVAVIGCGGMGCGALYHLAKRGVKVCGIEQYGIAHNLGSSHGETRIIRKAYFEHPDYMPLLNRSYELWDDLAQETGKKLMVQNGLIVGGKPDSETIVNLEKCYQKYSEPHECWTVAETRKRFPQFRIPEDSTVFYDPFGGFLFVETCVQVHLEAAQKLGAELFTSEKVLEWRRDRDGFCIQTTNGEIFADRLVLSMGAWSKNYLAQLGIQIDIWRKEVYWFRSHNLASFKPDQFPVYFFETSYGTFYGFPAINEKGLKIAEHSKSNIIETADEVNRNLESLDEEELLRFLSEYIPNAGQERTDYSVCMYSKTSDDDFILDNHPQDSNIVLAAGFSGHGFKFTPIVGEIMADLTLNGTTEHPIDFLRLSRFHKDQVEV